MSAPLRILLLEDNRDDADLLRLALDDAGIRHELRVVEKRAAFLAALHDSASDVVVSDSRLPGFTGIEALALAREHAPALPFWFSVGSLDRATDAAGAALRPAEGCVLKDDLAPLLEALKALAAGTPGTA